MDTFSIVTCGDKNYFPFLKQIESNIFSIYGTYPVIYDLGLEPEQKKNLKSPIRKIAFPETFSGYNSKKYIKAIHKPFCLLDFLTQFSLNCLYIDADTVFIEKVPETAFEHADICVTPRHPKERKPEYYTNGLINTGVIFFRNTRAVAEIMRQWATRCQTEDQTDQQALSELLSEHVDLLGGAEYQNWETVSIKLLDAQIYNDVSCSTGRILHFKNAGRTSKAFQKYTRFTCLQRHMPWGVRQWIAFKRRLKQLK